MHPSAAAQPLQRAKHETFIAHKLAISFAVLAFAPFFLVYSGAPTLSECLLFAFGLVPLAVAVFVARTGRLILGHAFTCCGLVGFALTLFFGTRAGAGASIIWLVLAQWEAGLAGDKRLTVSAPLGAVGVIAGMAFGGGPDGGAPLLSSFSLLLGSLASVYAVTLGSVSASAQATLDLPSEVQASGAASLIEALGDLFVGFDTTGSVDEITGPSEKIVRLPKVDLLGRGLFQIVHVGDRPMFLKLIADAAQADGARTAIIRMRAANDASAIGAAQPTFLWIELRAHRITANGEPRVKAVLRNVTATHSHELQAEETQRSVEASIRSKDDFLANMSHELRTPLNAIIGFSEMLASHTLRPADQTKQREYAHIILQSGQHLLAVVNSILDMSKIQSGTFALLSEPFNIGPLIEQCCDIVRLKAQEGRIRLLRDCPALEDIVGDKRACKQILINLLSNAVKFTPENGDVTVSARPDGNAILITVTDTGIGIGAEDLARLGDPFFQARSSLSRPFEGTGLGLSVVRGLLGLHGGTMTIESEPEKGTRVTVRLPLDCQAIRNKNTQATIETIPRRTASMAVRQPYELRMKSIA